jgi:hypothetical protein
MVKAKFHYNSTLFCRKITLGNQVLFKEYYLYSTPTLFFERQREKEKMREEETQIKERKKRSE